MANREKELEGIVSEASVLNNKETLAKILGMIDLTTLNTTDTVKRIAAFTGKVSNFSSQFPGYPNVAAICVYPNFTGVVKSALNAPGVKIAVVGGGFPASQTFTKIKVEECRLAAEAGADEVDIVLSLNYFLGGEPNLAAEEIKDIKKAIGDACLKVILETGALKERTLIREASMLAMESGADFIKTSTGKLDPAATPQAAHEMCIAIRDFHYKTGKKVGFKPAGGIVSPSEALVYYSITRSILGKEWLNKELFRIGASRLANNILSVLESKEISYF